MRRYLFCVSVFLVCSVFTACDEGPPLSPGAPASPAAAVADDADLFRLVTQREPFSSYPAFPGVPGIMAGFAAHQPMIRVSLNARAYGALQNGTLPAGSRFPDGSVMFKEILGTSGVMAYAVMYKASADPRASNGWLWAEFGPAGNAAYSITNRGSACTGCHSLDQGPRNDFVRIFERQR